MIIVYQDHYSTPRFIGKSTLIVASAFMTLTVGAYAISHLPTAQIELISPTSSEFEASIMQSYAPSTLANPQVITDTPVVVSPTSNSTTKPLTIPANTQEVTITDPNLTDAHNIVLSPISGDTSIYYLKSRTSTSFTVKSLNLSESDRVIDYSLVLSE